VFPAWSRDGASLYFVAAVSGEVRAVDVTLGPTLRVGQERGLFAVSRRFDATISPSADGRRLFMIADESALEPSAAAGQRPIHVIVNWAEALTERVLPR